MDWIIPVGIGVLAVLLLLLICWRRVPADKAMVITGLRKRVLVGAAASSSRSSKPRA